MAQTRISLVFGEQVKDMFDRRVREGSVSLHTDAMLCAGWRIHSTLENGSLTMEKEESIYFLEEHHEEKVQSESEKEGPEG